MFDKKLWEGLFNSEGGYKAWLRGALRKAWNNHPVKRRKLFSTRVRADVGVNGKTVYAWPCAVCQGLTRKPLVDHITQAGGFIDEESFKDWMGNLLLVTQEQLQVLCKDCHDIKTYSEKYSISVKHARIVKTAIELQKGKTDKEWLIDKNIAPASNELGRRTQIIEYLEVLPNE